MRRIEELRSDYSATLFDIRPWYGGYIGMIHLSDCGTCSVVWGYDEDGYEHVSISPKHKNKMPTWDDMAQLKDIFFYPEEEAYQIMPKHSEYVNVKENCLHLWRPKNGRELKELVKVKYEKPQIIQPEPQTVDPAKRGHCPMCGARLIEKEAEP